MGGTRSSVIFSVGCCTEMIVVQPKVIGWQNADHKDMVFITSILPSYTLIYI